jgi:Predicted methyltransferase (contains TPR repeat)
MGEPKRRGDYPAGWRTADAARSYELDLAREGLYGGWLEQRERELLIDVVDRWLGTRPIRHLDFACGTGRIAATLQAQVASTTGVDMSPEMLTVAKDRLPQAELVSGDIVADPSILHGRYDLITAFRFFLNAGKPLRNDVLGVLRGALADDGILLFNVHSNAWSLRAVSVLIRRLVLHQDWWNQLSYPTVRNELRDRGFEVVELHGYNYLTSKGYRLLPTAWVLGLERTLSRLQPLRYVAVDLLFVCRKTRG